MSSYKVSVFGLGYVGTVSSLCLAAEGNTVIGVDPNPEKVELLNRGVSPIVESGVPELLKEMLGANRISATADAVAALEQTEISLICVGTPSKPNGELELKYAIKVCEEIGVALQNKQDHVVVIRSTILPQSTRTRLIPILEKHSGKKAGVDFAVCFNPEFLREGSAVQDYLDPPKTVIGEYLPGNGDKLEQLYAALNAPLFRTSLEVAELVKYSDNAWHALKVAFANEIGSISKANGIDSFEVMDIFSRDVKLNISRKYLRPGFGFGGSCLPKDLRALNFLGRSSDIELPLLNSIIPANEAHIKRALEMVLSLGKRRVGFLGLSFKAGTDDLRESPLVYLVEQLIGKGYELRIYDNNVKIASLIGANRAHLIETIPHISDLLVESLDDVIDGSEVLIIGNEDPSFLSLDPGTLSGKTVVDFVRLKSGEGGDAYHGICW